MFDQARPAAAAAVIGATAICFLFAPACGWPAVLRWFSALLVTTAVRLRLFRQFCLDPDARSVDAWLRAHAFTVVPVAMVWAAVVLLPVPREFGYLHEFKVIVPGFVLMATITAFGVFYHQYLVFWSATTASVFVFWMIAEGREALVGALLFQIFAPVLLVTAKRYGASIGAATAAQQRMEGLVDELGRANTTLAESNTLLERQRAVIAEEARLARHVFEQLTLAGTTAVEGVHVWQQSMGTLSGDLVQTCRLPAGEVYFFVGDFTGHGLPAALGALPATSVFQAMAAKGLDIATIAAELNAKLHRLLPASHFCCAVLGRLAADRRRLEMWNGGLPPALLVSPGVDGPTRWPSTSLPLGVVGADAFTARVQAFAFPAGSRFYAYTDGITEARDAAGEMWGAARVERILGEPSCTAPRLPRLIEAVLAHVEQAPPSDDISVIEIEALPRVEHGVAA
ncbi:MAG: serine/threonine-protein phosphatase [Gammaproteobacteria bacterium]|nr:serine/threonine-protein phosphatase [Gammaproteobacteria bacterium]